MKKVLPILIILIFNSNVAMSSQQKDAQLQRKLSQQAKAIIALPASTKAEKTEKQRQINMLLRYHIYRKNSAEMLNLAPQANLLSRETFNGKIKKHTILELLMTHANFSMIRLVIQHLRKNQKKEAKEILREYLKTEKLKQNLYKAQSAIAFINQTEGAQAFAEEQQAFAKEQQAIIKRKKTIARKKAQAKKERSQQEEINILLRRAVHQKDGAEMLRLAPQANLLSKDGSYARSKKLTILETLMYRKLETICMAVKFLKEDQKEKAEEILRKFIEARKEQKQTESARSLVKKAEQVIVFLEKTFPSKTSAAQPRKKAHAHVSVAAHAGPADAASASASALKHADEIQVLLETEVTATAVPVRIKRKKTQAKKSKKQTRKDSASMSLSLAATAQADNLGHATSSTVDFISQATYGTIPSELLIEGEDLTRDVPTGDHTEVDSILLNMGDDDGDNFDGTLDYQYNLTDNDFPL